jgi:hypothetical protein
VTKGPYLTVALSSTRSRPAAACPAPPAPPSTIQATTIRWPEGSWARSSLRRLDVFSFMFVARVIGALWVSFMQTWHTFKWPLGYHPGGLQVCLSLSEVSDLSII